MRYNIVILWYRTDGKTVVYDMHYIVLKMYLIIVFHATFRNALQKEYSATKMIL